MEIYAWGQRSIFRGGVIATDLVGFNPRIFVHELGHLLYRETPEKYNDLVGYLHAIYPEHAKGISAGEWDEILAVILESVVIGESKVKVGALEDKPIKTEVITRFVEAGLLPPVADPAKLGYTKEDLSNEYFRLMNVSSPVTRDTAASSLTNAVVEQGARDKNIELTINSGMEISAGTLSALNEVIQALPSKLLAREDRVPYMLFVGDIKDRPRRMGEANTERLSKIKWGMVNLAAIGRDDPEGLKETVVHELLHQIVSIHLSDKDLEDVKSEVWGLGVVKYDEDIIEPLEAGGLSEDRIPQEVFVDIAASYFLRPQSTKRKYPDMVKIIRQKLPSLVPISAFPPSDKAGLSSPSSPIAEKVSQDAIGQPQVSSSPVTKKNFIGRA